MKFTFLFLLFAPIYSAFISPASIKRYSREINGNTIRVFEPKNINKSTTHSLLFFTGGNAMITSEVYTNFISKLASQNLTVYIAPSDLNVVEDVIDTMESEYLDITNIGHSSGAVSALRAANKNKDIKKIVLLDPVDSDKLFNSFNLKNNIPFFPQESNNLLFKYIDELLIINAKKSYEWKLFPPTIPFVPAFKMNTEAITKDKVKINVIEAENFGHSDILNPFWGDIMHKTISKGSDDRNEEVLDEYHEWLVNNIKNFIIEDNILNLIDLTDSESIEPSDYEYENIELL